MLALAHFLDRALALRPAGQAAAAGWVEEATSLVRSQLLALTADAPKVTLLQLPGRRSSAGVRAQC